MSNVDFSKITEGIYHVIETEEKIITGIKNHRNSLKGNNQKRPNKRINGHLIDRATTKPNHW